MPGSLALEAGGKKFEREIRWRLLLTKEPAQPPRRSPLPPPAAKVGLVWGGLGADSRTPGGFCCAGGAGSGFPPVPGEPPPGVAESWHPPLHPQGFTGVPGVPGGFMPGLRCRNCFYSPAGLCPVKPPLPWNRLSGCRRCRNLPFPARPALPGGRCQRRGEALAYHSPGFTISNWRSPGWARPGWAPLPPGSSRQRGELLRFGL